MMLIIIFSKDLANNYDCVFYTNHQLSNINPLPLERYFKL